jgi:hypothetical protein
MLETILEQTTTTKKKGPLVMNPFQNAGTQGVSNNMAYVSDQNKREKKEKGRTK